VLNRIKYTIYSLVNYKLQFTLLFTHFGFKNLFVLLNWLVCATGWFEVQLGTILLKHLHKM